MRDDEWVSLPDWPAYEGTPDGRLRHARLRREVSPLGAGLKYRIKAGGKSAIITREAVARLAAGALGVAPRDPAPADAPADAPAAPAAAWPPPGCRLSRRDAEALEYDRLRYRMATASRGAGCEWVPSPDEIKAACAAIRDEWTPTEERWRRGYRSEGPLAEPPLIGCTLDRVFRRNGRPCSRRAS